MYGAYRGEYECDRQVATGIQLTDVPIEVAQEDRKQLSRMIPHAETHLHHR